MKPQKSDYRDRALLTAMTALVRGGHVEEPSTQVKLAATNYCINEDMSRTLIGSLEDGTAGLVAEGDTLYLVFLEEGYRDVKMAVARLYKNGKVKYL